MHVDDALPAMQALASRLWTPHSRHHPGQLTWSARYGEDLDLGPVELFSADGPTGWEVAAWAWAESDDWLEVCVDPARPELATRAVDWFLDRAPSGTVRSMVLETETHVLDALTAADFRAADLPWFVHLQLDLAALRDVPEVEGYTFRHVEPGEAEPRAACHRAAWSPTSKVTAAAYERLMATPPYRPELDWVAVTPDDEMAASVCLWLDTSTGVALVEPLGGAEAHRGRGLAGAVSLAALHAARDLGATTGLVCPRGDDDYPVPARIYRSLGFEPVARTVTLERTS